MFVARISAVNPGVSVTTVMRESWTTDVASSTSPTPAFFTPASPLL